MRNRLHALCPYFAMFPETFVRKHVEAHTTKQDLVFDCFSGRGTTLLESLLLGRRAASIDINPVAYCISGAKAHVPALVTVSRALDELERRYDRHGWISLDTEAASLPAFFRRAFDKQTLRQLLFLRNSLAWRTSSIDRFVAALTIGTLHGEQGKPMKYFSNQMPRTISTKPAYSLRYWKEHDLWPERHNVFEVLRDRAEFRLNGDLPEDKGSTRLGDARRSASRFPDFRSSVRLCLTSPPYYNVTSYEEDQWLRLWFLGHQARAAKGVITRDDQHRKQKAYVEFLTAVWHGVAPLMKKGSVLVCRLGARGVTRTVMEDTLIETLKPAFPKLKQLEAKSVSTLKNRQTETFLPGTKGCRFEVDFVFATS